MALSAGVQKSCFKCKKEKPLEQFYQHPQMSDGHLGKCKDCTKADVAIRLSNKRQDIREYEQWRSQTASRKAKLPDYQRAMRVKYPEKYAARMALNNAVRDGRVERRPCEICGDLESEGHHHDYTKPFDVRWLCFKHHREIAHGQKVG